MRHLFLLFVLTTASFAQFRIPERKPAQVQTQADALRDDLIAKEHAIAEAFHRNDAPFVADLLAPAFRQIAVDGNIYNRPQTLASMPDVRYEELQLSEFEVSFLGGDSVLVTYRAKVKATAKGQQIAGLERVSDVWVRKMDVWRIAFRQVTLVSPTK